MMLSDVDLKNAIEEGELVISHFDENMLRAAGITMHLGAELLIPQSGKIVDVKNKITPDYKSVVIEDDTPYELKPGDFLLGATYEKVTVGSSLGFFIEGRSTLARLGLTIVQTAMLVYPGHTDRAITLELANHGPNSILLYHKMKIARAAVFKLQTRASINYDENGKYREQQGVGAPIFKDEIKK